MPNTLRIEVRTRNNVLWHAIFDHHATVAEFCRVHHLSNTEVGGLLNLTKNPRFRSGVDSPLAIRLAEICRMLPEELFPPVLYSGAFPLRHVLEVDPRFRGIEAAAGQPCLPAQEDEVVTREQHEGLSRALETLTPREEYIIRRRYGLHDGREWALAEIAKPLGLTTSRIRQIEAKALRKLRQPSRSRPLQPFWSMERDAAPTTTDTRRDPRWRGGKEYGPE